MTDNRRTSAHTDREILDLIEDFLTNHFGIDNAGPEESGLLQMLEHISHLLDLRNKTRSRVARPEWEMHIPVLNTAHVAPTTLETFSGAFPERVGNYAEGAFVDVGGLGDKELLQFPVLAPIAAWFRQAYPGEKWLRLDRDGDLIPCLPEIQW